MCRSICSRTEKVTTFETLNETRSVRPAVSAASKQNRDLLKLLHDANRQLTASTTKPTIQGSLYIYSQHLLD